MPSEEAAEVRYFAVGALPDRLAPVVRERILDSFGHEVVFRTQEGFGHTRSRTLVATKKSRGPSLFSRRSRA